MTQPLSAPLLSSCVRCDHCGWLQSRAAKSCDNCGVLTAGDASLPLSLGPHTGLSPLSVIEAPTIVQSTSDIQATLAALATMAEGAKVSQEGALQTKDVFYQRCAQRAVLLFQTHSTLWTRVSQIVRDDPAELISHVECVFSGASAWIVPDWAKRFRRETGVSLLLTHPLSGETTEALQQRLSAHQRVILCVSPGDEHRLSPWLYELLAAVVPLHVGSRRTFVRELGIEKHHARPRSLAALRELVQQTCICTDEVFHGELWSLIAEYAQ